MATRRPARVPAGAWPASFGVFPHGVSGAEGAARWGSRRAPVEGQGNRCYRQRSHRAPAPTWPKCGTHERGDAGRSRIGARRAARSLRKAALRGSRGLAGCCRPPPQTVAPQQP
eukprot:144628-Prymnesium_polylepis.1